MNHTEHAQSRRIATPCTAHHMTTGARCLNCGWRMSFARDDEPTESQREQRLQRFEREQARRERMY